MAERDVWGLGDCNLVWSTALERPIMEPIVGNIPAGGARGVMRLAAAAPRMLAVLEEIVSALDERPGREKYIGRDVASRARSAIAEATRGP